MGRDRSRHRSEFDRALRAAQDGSPAGFEWLWHRFGRQVSAFARLQGSEDPDGLAGLVFEAAFRRIGSFEGDGTAFVSQLFAIARNKVIDERRRRSRRPSTTALTGRFDPPGGDAEEDAMRGLGDDARRALAVLTDEQREVLLLRLVADLPIGEVARLTGRSESAVKAMQHRALLTIRRKISSGAVSL